MTDCPGHWRARLLRVAVSFAAAMAVVCTTTGALAQSQRALGVVELKVPGAPTQNLYAQSHALVIGASSYRNGWSRLPGVVGDVKAVVEVLVKQGFSVTQLADPNRDQLDAALRNFVAKHGQAPSNRLLVYFAGHGYTLPTAAGGKLGYIVPVDAPRPDQDLGGFKNAAYSMDSIEGLSKQIDARHALFVFDSCFSGTIFGTSRSGVPDSISDKTARPVRQFIASGDENQTVPDYSQFRRQFVAALGDGEADMNKDGYITGSELGMFLEYTVTNYSKRAQTPQYGKIRNPDLDKGDFVFVSPVQLASFRPEPEPGPSAARMEQQAWTAAQRANSAAAYNAYLAEYPRGSYAAAARVARAGLEPATRQPEAVAEQQPAQQAQPTGTAAPSAGQVFKDCADCPEMVAVPGGTFTMGSNDGAPNEKPVHSVTIRSFALGKHEVTQGQWKEVMGSDPSYFKACGDNCPVEQVSWDDIQQYIQKLNQKTGKRYRLPGEAEWEYAARAGSTTQYSWGDSIGKNNANCDGCGSQWDNKTTAPVGQFKPNDFGLYDMHGNVREWVQDYYHGSYRGAPSDGRAWESGGEQKARVLRGGSWDEHPLNLRSASHSGVTQDGSHASFGFRLARTAP